MPMSAATLKAELSAAFPDASIEIDDLAGDGDHYRARIVAKAFKGLSRIKQHQLVYGALQQELASEAIHALALQTSVPA